MLACAALVVLGLPTIAASPALAAPAADGPGALSHFDLARKDCLGTSRTTTSKVWFTVAGGVLSDVYYPTIDNTNVETLQYIVTDGSTFTDLQTRDMVSTASALDASGMSCRVTSTARSGKYKIVTDYVTDPDRNTLLMRTRSSHRQSLGSQALRAIRSDHQRQWRRRSGQRRSPIRRSPTPRPSIRFRLRTTPTRRPTRPTATMPSRCSPRSTARSPRSPVGTPAQTERRLDATRYQSSPDDGQRVSRQRQHRAGCPGEPQSVRATVTLALGFGATQSAAVDTAEQSLRHDFDGIRDDYEKGWAALRQEAQPTAQVAARPQPGARQRAGATTYYLSINVVKAAEDKTFPGAIVAGLSSPWGQAVSAGDPDNTYFGSYREVFARDLYEAWTGLMAAGDLADGARRDAVPVRAPAAGRWLDAAQLAGQRQDRPRLVRHATRRGRLPDPDGAINSA